jgi:Uma2 family endonuclease
MNRDVSPMEMAVAVPRCRCYPRSAVPPIKRSAGYEDLLALPDRVIGEIVDGKPHVSPRPAPLHGHAASVLGEELGPPFRRGRGGPGGWVFYDEPEIHLGEDIVVPDLGGWRRERLPEMPTGLAYFAMAPDWICEVLSPLTAAFDRGEKLAVYAQAAVGQVWFIDPVNTTLEVLRLDGPTYRIVQVASGEALVRAEPFDAIELDLRVLWRH